MKLVALSQARASTQRGMLLHEVDWLEEAVKDFSRGAAHGSQQSRRVLQPRVCPGLHSPHKPHNGPSSASNICTGHRNIELMLVCAGGTLLHKLKRLDEAVRFVFQPAH